MVTNTPSIEAARPPCTRLAAGVLAFDDRGRVLAVARGTDLADWGLPFGLCEPGERPEQAARRETLEETGMDAVDLRYVFAAQAGDCWAITFLAKVSGEPRASDEGEAAWVERELLTRSTSSFAQYNRALFAHLEGRRPV